MTVATSTDRARLGDLEIAYQSRGAGEPALLFVHGIAADRSYFASQLAGFEDHRRVALDLRGHGLSSAASQVTLDDFAADVIAVADAAGLRGAVICSHSMAGVVGLKVAGARPDLVRGVAMIDGTVLFPKEVRQQGLAGLVPALAGDHWFEALSGYFLSRILDPSDPEDLRQRVLDGARQTRQSLVHSFFADLFTSDYAAELERTRCPLLYIHAKAPADLARLREIRPDALIEEMAGSGHYPMLTAPDQVNAMLERFRATVDERPS